MKNPLTVQQRGSQHKGGRYVFPRSERRKTVTTAKLISIRTSIYLHKVIQKLNVKDFLLLPLVERYIHNGLVYLRNHFLNNFRERTKQN